MEKEVVVYLVLGLVAFTGAIDSDPRCERFPNGEIELIPYQGNCTLYWECYNGDSTLERCPPGLYYNPVVQSCDFTIGLNCIADPICQNAPWGAVTAYPFEGNCTLYWECYEGDSTLRACSNGLYFNPVEQACDFPDHSGCRDLGPVCPATGVDYLPYPDDCSKYYECYNGDSYVLTCPPGFWFSEALKHCELPEASGCGNVRPPTTTTPKNTYTPPNAVCFDVLPGEILLVPYPGDCRLYYECWGFEIAVMICPPGLYFDYYKQTCDWPWAVDCDDTTRTPNPHTTTPPPDQTVKPPPTVVTAPTPGYDPRCEGGELSYWPFPVDCSKYIECYGGQSYLMDCPPGLFFDEATVRCTNPEESDCVRSKTTLPPSRETTTRGPNWTAHPLCPWPPIGQYLFPYEGDCTKFLECDDGILVEMDCPAGEYFSSELLVCVYPWQTNCPWARYHYLPKFMQKFFERFF